jgi:hypothetical protein
MKEAEGTIGTEETEGKKRQKGLERLEGHKGLERKWKMERGRLINLKTTLCVEV